MVTQQTVKGHSSHHTFITFINMAETFGLPVAESGVWRKGFFVICGRRISDFFILLLKIQFVLYSVHLYFTESSSHFTLFYYIGISVSSKPSSRDIYAVGGRTYALHPNHEKIKRGFQKTNKIFLFFLNIIFLQVLSRVFWTFGQC